MTPSAFAAARQQLGVTQLELALRLGVSDAAVNDYEQGHCRVPRDIAQTVLRLVGRAPVSLGPCAQCRRKTVVEFHDRCCGRCTKPLPENDDAP